MNHGLAPRSAGTRRRVLGRGLGIALAVAMAAATGACGGADDDGDTGSASGDSDDPIVIGMSLPLTGPVADRAEPGYNGYKYWVEELNANGGLLGRQVELRVLDDGFDQRTAIADYTRLIGQDRVDLVLGTFSSDLNLAVAPIAERYEYVYVEPSGGADDIFARNFNYLFFAQPATTQRLPNQFVDLIEQMPEGERPETVAYVTVEDPNTTQAAGIFKERLEDLGLQTVLESNYTSDTTNFDAIANSVKQAAPDLVINGALAADGVGLIRSFQRLGFSPDMLYQANSPTDPTFGESIGEGATEGIFTFLAWSPAAQYPGNTEFVAGYEEQFGIAASEDAANSYTAGQVLAAAVEAVGSLDQPAIADWLHENTVETIVGPLSWDSAGRPQGELLLGQFQNGVLEVVAPPESATSDEIVYNKPAW